MMRKILLASACAGLLALGAAPAMAAGPITFGTKGQTVNDGAIQNVEYRRNQWQGRREWRQAPRPHYNAPGWGNRSYSPFYGRSNWGNWGNYNHNPGYWRHHHQGYWWR